MNNLELVVNKCINYKIPFVVFQKPLESNITFFSNPSGDQFSTCNSTCFTIVDFNSKNSNGYKIYKELDIAKTLEYCDQCSTYRSPSIVSSYQSPTQINDYITKVNQIVNILKKEGGKVVLSKVTCGQHSISNFYKLVENYFSYYANSFRYLYFTPTTGCWIGASPEILLKYDCEREELQTMSLAGTRIFDKTNAPWDLKNIEEHNYVTQYIVNKLTKVGLNINVSDEENLQFGDIEHLCHRILANNVNATQIEFILDELNPTPALAGYPLKKALDTIHNFENHERRCYGGYVSICNNKNIDAYVNIRCANFDATHFCIYSGGGLTKDSDPSAEWEETENKIKRLKELFR